MKINYKVSNRSWAKWLRKLKSSPQKFKTSTDYVRAQCLIAILQEIEPKYNKLHQMSYEFDIKTIENSNARIYRDEFGKEIVRPDPVFTNNQRATIKSKWWADLFLIVLFGFAESFIYVMSASTFMPGSVKIIQIIVGAFFAIGLMYTLGYSFNIKQTYLEARDRFAAKEIPESQLKWLRNKLHYSYGFLIGCFLAIVAAGLSRIYFFENIDHKGLTDAQYHTHVMAIKLISAFTLIFTVVVSFFIGFKKNDFGKINIQFWDYQSWHGTHKRRNRDSIRFIKFAQSLLAVAEIKALEYWSVVVGSKWVYQDAEYDVKFEPHNAEYWQLRSTSKFEVTGEVYRKYFALQSAYEELFRFGIVNDPAVMNKINEAAELMKIPKEHVAEHMKAIEEAKKVKTITPAFSANGNSKNEVTFNNNNHNGMKIATLLAALAASTLTFSCKTTEPQHHKNVLILPDLSGSRDTSIITWYKGCISNSIIHSMGMKDGFSVLPIDAASVQAGLEIQICDFAKNDYSNESAGQQQAEAELSVHHDSLAAVQQRFERLYDAAVVARKTLNGGTDITGAISLAKKYAAPGNENIIVILSDMLIYANYGSGLIDFKRNLNDTSQIASFLAKMPRVDLTGFKVLVITGAQPHISAIKYAVIERLWERWFAQCHADLRVYASGSVSLIEKELQAN